MPLDRPAQLISAAAESGHISWPVLVRAHAALDTYFSEDRIKALKFAVASEHASRQQISHDGTHVRSDDLRRARARGAREREARERAGLQEHEVSLDVGPETYFDKEGKPFEREHRRRTITTRFSQSTVEAALSMLLRCAQTALDVEMANNTPPELAAERSGSTRCVLIWTPAMKNRLRTGLAPRLPAYVTAALWRGERLTARQLTPPGSPPVEQLLVGLSWKIPPAAAVGAPATGTSGMHGGRPIIDLSASLYDKDFKFLKAVSWQNLTCCGITHSGDWCGQSAAAGETVRETITIDARLLLEGHPEHIVEKEAARRKRARFDESTQPSDVPCSANKPVEDMPHDANGTPVDNCANRALMLQIRRLVRHLQHNEIFWRWLGYIEPPPTEDLGGGSMMDAVGNDEQLWNCHSCYQLANTTKFCRKCGGSRHSWGMDANGDHSGGPAPLDTADPVLAMIAEAADAVAEEEKAAAEEEKVAAEASRSGSGTIKFRNGVTYRGQYDAGRRPHGSGTMTFRNGDTYVGQYDAGRRHGHGKFVAIGSHRGEYFEGRWKEDMPVPVYMVQANGHCLECNQRERQQEVARQEHRWRELGPIPSCKYIVIGAYAYSGQDMDALDEASMYVANPHGRGAGPGGMQVLTACRLTGAGTVNAGLCLTLHAAVAPGQPPGVEIMALDHTVKGSQQATAEGASRLLGRVVKAAVDAPDPITLGPLACLYASRLVPPPPPPPDRGGATVAAAAGAAPPLFVLHGGQTSLQAVSAVPGQQVGENSMEFMRRLRITLAELEPASQPDLSLLTNTISSLTAGSLTAGSGGVGRTWSDNHELDAVPVSAGGPAAAAAASGMDVDAPGSGQYRIPRKSQAKVTDGSGAGLAALEKLVVFTDGLTSIEAVAEHTVLAEEGGRGAGPTAAREMTRVGLTVVQMGEAGCHVQKRTVSRPGTSSPAPAPVTVVSGWDCLRELVAAVGD